MVLLALLHQFLSLLPDKPFVRDALGYQHGRSSRIVSRRRNRKGWKLQLHPEGDRHRNVEETAENDTYASAIIGLIDHLGMLSSTATRLHTELLNAEADQTENERQDAIHLRYVQKIGEAQESAREHLEPRADEAPSEIRVIAARPLAPPSVVNQPGVARAAELHSPIRESRKPENRQTLPVLRRKKQKEIYSN
ncbi:hypothetical protein OUZ56_012736 [Daphnia magna]|uniref:Uncharacterized protein n=1 Tax=Daphnia magna TaxID=35525 RepID=A0ABQ9Z3W6_9CRUS|nr:hypothetical protein OUZ56_012736 [Daphnia magna]